MECRIVDEAWCIGIAVFVGVGRILGGMKRWSWNVDRELGESPT